MLAVRRVLYPTDQSASAAHAYSTAVGLAAALGAELHVIHVALPDIEDIRGTVEESELTPEAPPTGLRVIRSVRRGDSAAPEIITYCQEHDIDVVVMGTRGRSGVGRLLLGSVAERVVREAPCPVLTVPARAPGQAVSRVLAAVDFSPHSRTTLEHAIAMADHYGAPLDVLHVLQEVTLPSAYGPELAPMITPQIEGRSHEALAELAAEVDLHDVSVELHTRFGYPASEILRFAEEYGVDLIVLATHGLTGLEHFLIGSVAERVVRKATCPVLTVRSFGKRIAGGAPA